MDKLSKITQIKVPIIILTTRNYLSNIPIPNNFIYTYNLSTPPKIKCKSIGVVVSDISIDIQNKIYIKKNLNNILYNYLKVLHYNKV